MIARKCTRRWSRRGRKEWLNYKIAQNWSRSGNMMIVVQTVSRKKVKFPQNQRKRWVIAALRK